LEEETNIKFIISPPSQFLLFGRRRKGDITHQDERERERERWGDEKAEIEIKMINWMHFSLEIYVLPWMFGVILHLWLFKISR
jgi:hypothetical protein